MRWGTPEKTRLSDTVVYPIELHVIQNTRSIIMVTRPVVMEMPVHVGTMCTRPFPPPPEGPGYEAIPLPKTPKVV